MYFILAKSSRKENQPSKPQVTSAINQQQNSNKDVPQSSRTLYQQKQQQQPTPNANISVPMPQPPKPNNKTQRNKEINRKGAEKQANASDMDAFNSPSSPPAAPVAAPILTMPAQLQNTNASISSTSVSSVSNNFEANPISAADNIVNSVTQASCEPSKLLDNKDNALLSISNNMMNKPASKNALPKTLDGSKKVDVTSIVKGSDVMPKFAKKDVPKVCIL